MDLGFKDGMGLQSMKMGILQQGSVVKIWKLKLQDPYKEPCLTYRAKVWKERIDIIVCPNKRGFGGQGKACDSEELRWYVVSWKTGTYNVMLLVMYKN